MKNVNSIIFAAIILILLVGCKKKSDPPAASDSNNGFTRNGVFYSTPNGVYIHEGDSLFGFMFYSGSISFDHVNQCWVGKGNATEISELISHSVQNHFPNGNYVFRNEGGTGFFDDAGTAINYSFDSDSGYMEYCVRGDLSIIPTGTRHEITYTFHNEDSILVTGKFTGNLQDITSWVTKKNRHK